LRHRIGTHKLSRNSGQRKALFRSQVRSLVLHEAITTTEAKAKALRPIAEKVITWGCRAARAIDEADTRDTRARAVHCRRMAYAFIQDNAVISKVFDDLALRYKLRPGGYTRILKLGNRVGDAAPIARIELV